MVGMEGEFICFLVKGLVKRLTPDLAFAKDSSHQDFFPKRDMNLNPF